MRMSNRKRSSCASGSGYVPSCSIGFCVASTKNGSGSGIESPATVTRCSCIASSSAACVRGGARLISSASRMLAKTGPRTNRNVRWPVALSSSRISVPVMSLGHEVRRELDAPELEVHRFRDRADHQRLRESGDADEQRVAAGDHRHEDFVEDVTLADDAPGAPRRAGAPRPRAAPRARVPAGMPRRRSADAEVHATRSATGGSAERKLATCWSNMYDDAETLVPPLGVRHSDGDLLAAEAAQREIRRPDLLRERRVDGRALREELLRRVEHLRRREGGAYLLKCATALLVGHGRSPGGAYSSGRVSVKVDPWPGADTSPTSPRNRRATPRASAKPEPGSAVPPRRRPVDLTELVEHEELRGRLDADAGILYAVDDLAVGDAHRGANLALRGEFERVGKKANAGCA